MARLATQEDFELGGLYDPPYHEYPFFAQRAAWIHQQYPTSNKILIVGCAYGYLVKHLRLLGRQAWGYDASSWAIGKAIPEAAPYIMYSAGASNTDRRAIKAMAGIASNARWDLAVTEDVIPCLTDNENTTLKNVIQTDAVQRLHIVTDGLVTDTHVRRNPTLNWKTLEQWQTFYAPDRVLSAESWRTLP